MSVSYQSAHSVDTDSPEVGSGQGACQRTTIRLNPQSWQSNRRSQLHLSVVGGPTVGKYGKGLEEGDGDN